MVAKLLCRGALTTIRNRLGNDPLALTQSSKCADMILRVRQDDEKERSRLTVEAEEKDSQEHASTDGYIPQDATKYLAPHYTPVCS